MKKKSWATTELRLFQSNYFSHKHSVLGLGACFGTYALVAVCVCRERVSGYTCCGGWSDPFWASDPLLHGGKGEACYTDENRQMICPGLILPLLQVHVYSNGHLFSLLFL